MSSQLTSLVPVFDGSNWSTWSKAMTAFFMSQGLWGYVAGTIPVPVVAAGPPPVTAADVALWNKNDEMARGNLTLRLSPAVQQAVSGNTSQILWDAIVTPRLALSCDVRSEVCLRRVKPYQGFS